MWSLSSPRTAHEILAWTITQDTLGDFHQDPVTVTQDVVEWICATM